MVRPLSTEPTGVVFYLAKDGDRTIALVAERDGRLFCYIPNVDAFVYNKPMSVDFLIDRSRRYDQINTADAARIIGEGRIGRIDGGEYVTLWEWATSEPLRMNPEAVLGAPDPEEPRKRPHR
ncbi:hypothetical protein MTY66_58190 [Mycolicibacterium sp. TY66]|uniref:hypothetical protein n=1 Tax=Mycobacteriaceae TaxID=1762 RepID=UPI001BB3B297|nr:MULTISPECIES: hypothetical protein [unclassified Mycolicibacterium]BCI84194.1 hypothetical protein MTY66_58190 [Mycolicibacterium sp. TY66]BCJ84185.1 hypothetical protein MTY81_55580 [Mycolicibacterium sp. TY81]